MNPQQKNQHLVVEKLNSSGLTLDDAIKLRMRGLTPQQTASLNPSFKPLHALQLNYLGPDGKPLSDMPKGAPFFRLRYLESPANFDTDAKLPRYVQPPNTAPAAYFPQNQPAWSDLAGTVDEPLILCEGELKAAKAVREGFPTIGLGGVWAWRAHRQGLEWLPSLELVKWHRRNVYLTFDSDYRENEQVCKALKALADELHYRGAFVHLVSLPNIDGLEKVGLDDFLVHAGAHGVEQLKKLLHEAEPLGLTRSLWALNSRYVVVRNPGMVLETDTLHKLPLSQMAALESVKSAFEGKLLKDGTVAHERTAAGAAWLQWPLRNEAAQLVYEPGKPQRTEEGGYNLWTGWGAEPRKGDVTLFLKLVDHLFSGAEPGAKEWFLRWCAYPIQFPGQKLTTAVVLHGVKHGTGKSLLGYTLATVYGKNAGEISQLELHGSFNEWAECKQLIIGDDVTGTEQRQHADQLKKLITQREVRINTKYVPSFTLLDRCNYFFTANHPDAFVLEDDDRRFFIHEIVSDALPPSFFHKYDAWLWKTSADKVPNESAVAALHYYLRTLKLGDWHPNDRAMMTAAKARMIRGVRSDLAGWVRNMLEQPEQHLRVGGVAIGKDLFTTAELLGLYDGEGKTKVTANGMARELARAGIHQANNGQPVGSKEGAHRYFVLRNPEKWLTAKPAQLTEHLNGWLASCAEAAKPRKKKY